MIRTWISKLRRLEYVSTSGKVDWNKARKLVINRKFHRSCNVQQRAPLLLSVRRKGATPLSGAEKKIAHALALQGLYSMCLLTFFAMRGVKYTRRDKHGNSPLEYAILIYALELAGP